MSFVNQYIFFVDFVYYLKNHIQEIGRIYNVDINRQHIKAVISLNLFTFSKIK